MFPHKLPKFDPVQYEIERRSDRRRPFFQRNQTQGIIACLACLLLVLIWFVLRLLGFDIPFPFHFL
jgi:hypothetical protein